MRQPQACEASTLWDSVGEVELFGVIPILGRREAGFTEMKLLVQSVTVRKRQGRDSLSGMAALLILALWGDMFLFI